MSLDGETPGQQQARLRRERRNAKIQAGGSERLNKITSLSGRPAGDETISRPTSSSNSSSQIPNTISPTKSFAARADDPDEVDISEMAALRQPSEDPSLRSQEDMIRQMLRTQDPLARGTDTAGAGAEDPMMQMMQQMMGGAAGAGGAGGGLPPGLAEMLGGAGVAPQKPAGNADYLWRVVHAVISVLLAFFAISSFTFTGSQLSRTEFLGDDLAPRMFWLFATAQLILQSTRYFVDGGELPRSGMLSKVSAFLPEPYAGYVRVVNRYGIIFSTVRNDAMIIVFVLGCTAWWKGLAAS